MKIASTHLFFRTAMRGHGCRIDFEAVIAGLSFIGLGPCPIEMVPRFYDLPQSYQEKGDSSNNYV